MFTFLLVTIFSIPQKSGMPGSKGNREEMSSSEGNSSDQVNAGATQISESNKERVSTSLGECSPYHFSGLMTFSLSCLEHFDNNRNKIPNNFSRPSL